MPEASIPSVVAMLVCDQVIMEYGTGKKSLIGIFENINAAVFPAPTRLGIYAKLVDAEGDYKFLLRLVNLKDESKVAEILADGKGIRREGAAELILNAGLVFPEPGKYELQLYANDAFLHRITMNAQHLSGGIQWQPQKSRR